MERQLYPRLHNPIHGTVLSLDACKHGRYLLTGNKQGSLSIYDLSPWGSPKYNLHHHHLEAAAGRAAAAEESSSQTMSTHHRPPIQQATAQPQQGFVVSCQWYPVDTGMFFSACRSGIVQCWDTNEMVPISAIKPFQFAVAAKSSYSLSTGRRGNSVSGSSTTAAATAATTLSCMQVSPSNGLTLAVGSSTCSAIKLIDVRSGSSSHTLTGHNNNGNRGGVLDLAWSTACPFVLASGGTDSCILLWDIRKAGSLGRITALDMEERQQTSSTVCDVYHADYAHLRQRKQPLPTKTRITTAATTTSGRRNHPKFNSKQKSMTFKVSPNNYGIKNKLPLAHHGGCVGLEFSPDGHYLVSAGGNGDLTVWDLRNKGAAYPIPRRFVCASGSAAKPVDSRYMGRVPLVLEQPGNGDSTRIWTRRGAHLCAYTMHQGGSPETVLKGHMGHVTAISKIGSTGQLVSAASDGLLLLWGPAGWSSSSESVQRRRGKRTRQMEDRDDW